DAQSIAVLSKYFGGTGAGKYSGSSQSRHLIRITSGLNRCEICFEPLLVGAGVAQKLCKIAALSMLLVTGAAICLPLNTSPCDARSRVTLRTFRFWRATILITTNGPGVTITAGCAVHHSAQLVNTVELLSRIVRGPGFGKRSRSQLLGGQLPLPLSVLNRISD